MITDVRIPWEHQHTRALIAGLIFSLAAIDLTAERHVARVYRDEPGMINWGFMVERLYGMYVHEGVRLPD